ncbi:MAG: DNA repair protein RecO [Omnitrophica WOR_2 bacterium]|jgi:DNA repair protein RecO (recombination protein O)
MLESTRGIVFHVTRYSESSGIIKIFTEESGLQTFIIKSLFSRSAKLKPALFGHLNILDLVIDNKPGRPLQYIRDASLNRAFHEITDSMPRSSILVFMNEVLYKAIREEEANFSLFQFIEYSLEALNDIQIPVQSFHLLFLIKLSEYLGFGPAGSLTSSGDHFDLLSGLPDANSPAHDFVINGQSLDLLRSLSLIDYSDLGKIVAPRQLRLDLLDKLIDFYRIHLPEMSELKSVKIFHEIMS